MSPHTLEHDHYDYLSRVPALLVDDYCTKHINISMILMIRADVLTDLVKDILEASLSGLATAIHLRRNE